MFYSQEVKNLFDTPLNAGVLSNPSITVQVGSPKEGAVIKLQLLIENNIIVDAKFKAYGAMAIAVMSYVTQKVIGKSLETAMFINSMELAQDLNIDSMRLHNCLLAVDALQEAITQFKKL